MYRIGFAIIVISLLTAGSGLAEFYRYTDQSGAVRFTDDYSQIPESQRQQVKKYTEAPASPADSAAKTPQTGDNQAPDSREAPTPAAEENAPSAAAASNAPAAGEEAPVDWQKQRQELEKQKQALDKTYTRLAKEMESLELQKAEAKSRNQIKAYNQRVVELNRKIEAYEEQRRGLDQKISAYNQNAGAKD